MKIQAFILGTALVIPLTAAAQVSQPAGNPAQQSVSQLSQKDKLFLHAIASEDQSEIDLARLALRKTKKPQIQQYARSKILAADPEMEKGAIEIAQQNHATISSQPNAAARQQYKDFARLSGDPFDRAYAKYENRMQSSDLKVVSHEAGSAANPQVRSYAQREQTPVKQAAESARKLAQLMKVGPAS